MTMIMCPHCKVVTTVQPGAGNQDIVHDCNSGNPTLDNEDVFDLDNNPTWNWKGLENQLSVKAKIMGENFEGVTRRGNRRTSYRQENKENFIKLNDNFVIRGDK